MSEWQTIDSAPKDGRASLVYCKSWCYPQTLIAGWDAHEKAWRIIGMGCPFAQPTHWMPLPAPPEA